MKFVNLAIGSILLLEALALLYSPTEKYNFHSFVGLVKNQWQECPWLQSICFECTQKLRLFAVSLIFTGALSLTFCDNVLVGFLAQLIWTITQTESYYSNGMLETRNTLTQIIFTIILLGSTLSQLTKCSSKQKQTEKISVKEQTSKASGKLKEEIFESGKQKQALKKEKVIQKQSIQKTKPKSKKKI